MVQHFHKPENALKRARELLEVGKQASALKALHDVIASKRHRSWTKTSEEIQLQFLELCVEMRRGKTAKDGLHQYKNMCQQVSIQSLETVIRFFIKLSEAKAEEARSKASGQLTGLADVDDLEEADTPEDLILSTMTTENTQDRTDREILTPWLKFLWETYRTVLEILRNNPKLENLYQETAQNAFLFCLKYQRKTEFRRLCDLLRTHLQNVQKYANQTNTINLNNPESLQLHLETRFAQLKAAASLELWQEAFRSIEDIHGLIGLSKRVPKPQMMAAYFENLAAVFWKSGNYLFHAYAWLRLFNLSRESKKNLSQEEAAMLATNVLLAILVIPVAAEKNASEAYLEIDSTQEKQQRLALLVGLSQPPTRASLVRDLKAKNVLRYVAPELQSLYHWVEEEFHPLQLCDKVSPLLDYIRKDEGLEKYAQPLQQTVLIRLLQQLSKVYQTMQTSVLCSLAQFASRHEIEKFLVDCVRSGTLQARLNHRSGTISFGADMFFTSEGLQDGSNPNYASMQTEHMRDMLTQVSRGLSHAMRMIAPQRRVEKQQRKAMVFQKYVQLVSEEHRRILERKQLIEERKFRAERDKERAAREAERTRPKQVKAEAAPVVVAMEKIKQEEQKEQINQIQKQNEDDILRKVVEIEEEKRKLQSKLKQVERKNDHFQRALRLAEVPKLLADWDQRKTADQEYLQQQYVLEVERARADHTKALQLKKDMEKMANDMHTFIATVRSRHEDAYKQELENFERYCADEVVRRKEERAHMKEQMRREREEEERRQAEEEERRRREDEARAEEERLALIEAERKREEEEVRRKEREEERRKLDEVAERQRQRELEAEEKFKAKLARPAERERAPVRDERGARGGEGWARREEAPREDAREWNRSGPPAREPAREEEQRRGGGGGDGWRRDERPAPRGGDDRRERDTGRGGDRDGGRSGDWGRRDEEPRGGRGGDRRPEQREGEWSRSGAPAPARGEKEGGSEWRRGASPARREERPRSNDGGNWRSDAAPQQSRASPAPAPASAPAPPKEPERVESPMDDGDGDDEVQDDGFTTVTKGRKGRR